MSLLRFTVAMLTIAGCWQPFRWTSFTKHTLYNVYTIVIISVMCFFTFTQFIDLILYVDNPEDLTGILYTMLSMCVVCYKIFNLWMNHDSIAILIQNLSEGLFKPLVPDEIAIQRRFDRMTYMYALYYTVLIDLSIAGTVFVSLLTNFRDRKLTFREWIPYDYSSYLLFCITYIYQYLNVICCAVINIGCDSLIVGLLLHICCQITILKYRLKNIRNNRSILRNCIRHHHHIIAYAHAINQRFTKIIAFQFVISTFVICSNLYQLTRTRLDASHISILTYTCCVLTQIFIYCWFGNKLKVVSLHLVDSIFEMDWITLDENMKKSLLIIMKRAMIPLEFNSAYILNMNLNSFVTLLKTSYSAYNLLIQV